VSNIRNIGQTNQEKEVIKVASDVTIYIDGLPYVINPYLNQDDGNIGALVNINDYFTNISTAYELDNYIPSCSISLSVPNDQSYLFMVPGGNHLFKTMALIEVYAKGYYPSRRSNSVYHRIFKGLISHATYNTGNTSLEIGIQCYGILHFLELIQIDMNPSNMSFSPNPTVPTTTRQAELNAFEQLEHTILDPITFEGFQVYSVSEDSSVGKGGPYEEALKRGYIAKWQNILNDFARDVHIYGPKVLRTPVKDSEAKGKLDPATLAVKDKQFSKRNEVEQRNDIILEKMQECLPDMGVGTIQLLNGSVTSRLARIRTITSALGFEGYQDVDGSVIIKPPLWNLDVTNLEEKRGMNVSGQVIDDNDPLTPETNPFIIHQSEIIGNEQETEDQSAVHCTRILVMGVWDTRMAVNGNNDCKFIGEYIDTKLVAQFGLREEAPLQINFIPENDKLSLFAFAVNEMARRNRGYRTYTVTIPLRPEMKLGFPCYMPHRDMYGYIRSISINYQIGGNPTMTVTMDCLRRRVISPREHFTNAQTGEKQIIFVSQPNLINAWTSYTPGKPGKIPNKPGSVRWKPAEGKDTKPTTDMTDSITVLPMNRASMMNFKSSTIVRT
jgi:hypothetical protein